MRYFSVGHENGVSPLPTNALASLIFAIDCLGLKCPEKQSSISDSIWKMKDLALLVIHCLGNYEFEHRFAQLQFIATDQGMQFTLWQFLRAVDERAIGAA
jgi:hypothetical protein